LATTNNKKMSCVYLLNHT